MNLKEKVLSFRRKICVVAAAFAMFMLNGISVFADVSGGLQSAETNVVGQLKPAINGTAVPILLVLLVGGLVVAIVHAVYSYRKGRDIELGWIIALAIGITLVATFPTWGWQLIG